MKEGNLVRGALERLTGTRKPAPRNSQEWLSHWRELAQVTYGITGDDPRYEPVLRWLDVCDAAFVMGSWAAFQEAAEQVKAIAKGKR
jgi:hypothetical protein